MRGLGSLRSFLKTLETYFVNSIEGEWGSPPFLPFPAQSDGTYLLSCDLITVFLNVIKLICWYSQSQDTTLLHPAVFIVNELFSFLGTLVHEVVTALVALSQTVQLLQRLL